jgi:hypothetical protein
MHLDAHRAAPDRLDLELYIDRLERHGDRLRDELAAARLRAAWTSLEEDLRNDLTQSQTELLQAIGVLAPIDSGEADTTVIHHRTLQLDALARLQQLVEQRIETLREAARQ